MKDIPIKSFVDTARNVQDLNATIAVDSEGKKNKLLGGRSVGLLPPNTDTKTLVTHSDVFRGQLKKTLSKAYSNNETDRQYQMIAKAAGLLDKKGTPIKGPLTVAQVEVVRIELAHRGLGKLRKQPGGGSNLSTKTKENLLDIAYYTAGKKKYDKARLENVVDITKSTAPQQKLDDKQLEQLTESAKNTLKKGRLGNLVDRQLARLNKSGIEEPHRKLLESKVVLGIAFYARHKPGINPFTVDQETKGAIRDYQEAKEKNKVPAHMNEIQKECDLFASNLKEHPFSEERLLIHDNGLRDARLYAMGWMKYQLKDGKEIVKAIDKTFSNLKIKNVDFRYDAETVITLRAYDKYRKRESLTKEDVKDILQAVNYEYKHAEKKESGDKLYEYWRTPINDFVMGVYDLVGELHGMRKARRNPPKSPPPPAPNVQRKRVANQPEKSRLAAKTPSVIQQTAFTQNAFKALVDLGYEDKLNGQLARLEHTIKDADLQAQASELLVLQALAGYDKLRRYFSDNDKVQVQRNMVEQAIDTLTNDILKQHKGGIEASNLHEVSKFWLKQRDEAINDIKAGVGGNKQLENDNKQ